MRLWKTQPFYSFGVDENAVLQISNQIFIATQRTPEKSVSMPWN